MAFHNKICIGDLTPEERNRVLARQPQFFSGGNYAPFRMAPYYHMFAESLKSFNVSNDDAIDEFYCHIYFKNTLTGTKIIDAPILNAIMFILNALKLHLLIDHKPTLICASQNLSVYHGCEMNYKPDGLGQLPETLANVNPVTRVNLAPTYLEIILDKKDVSIDHNKWVSLLSSMQITQSNDNQYITKGEIS